MKLSRLYMLLLCVVVSCSDKKKLPENPSDEKVSAEIRGTEPSNVPSKLKGKVSMDLESGEARYKKYPDSFWIPTIKVRENLKKGQLVKLLFLFRSGSEERSERMWVVIDSVTDNGYTGILDNQPHCTDQYQPGFKIHFKPMHVIDVWED